MPKDKDDEKNGKDNPAFPKLPGLPGPAAPIAPKAADKKVEPPKVEPPAKNGEDAESDAKKTLREVRALQSIISELEKNADRPSGAAQTFSLLLGGLPLEVTGGYKREREFRRMREDVTKRYWERRKSNLAEEAAKARIAGTKKSLLESDHTAVAYVLGKRQLMPQWLPQNTWAKDILSGTPAEQEVELAGMVKNVFSGKADPRTVNKFRQLKGRIEHYEELRDKKRKDWEEHGAANSNPRTGEYIGPIRQNEAFRLDGVDYNPTDPLSPDSEMYEYAAAGAMEAQTKANPELYQQIAKNGSTAERLLEDIATLQGADPKQSKQKIMAAMMYKGFALEHTSITGLKALTEQRNALEKYKGKTGQLFSPDPEALMHLGILEADNEAILQEVKNLPPNSLDRRKTLLRESQGLMRRIHTVRAKTTLFGAEQVKEANRVLESLEGKRDQLVDYFRKSADKDTKDFLALITPQYLQDEAAMKNFFEEVTLGPNNRVVAFDAREGHKQSESWERIKPGKRNEALATGRKKTIQTYDADGRPQEFWEGEKRVAEMGPEAKRKVRGGTERDAQFLAGLFAPGQNRGKFREINEVDADGRLNRYSLSRRQALRLLARDVAMEQEANVRVARDLLTPELNDFEAYSPNVDYDGYTKLNTRAEVLNFIAKVDARKLVADPLGSGKKFRESIKNSQFKGKAANLALTDVLKANASDKKKLELAIAKFLLEFWAQSAYETK